MHKPLRDHEIVNVIGGLASQGETGRLHITAGTTEGAVFFDKGEIVDASLGKLNGFQAINAIASIRDATFNFDPSITPPVESPITPNERILLDDFFGIGRVHREPHYFDRLKPNYFDRAIGPPNNAPAPVVPLGEVEDRDNASMVHTQPTQLASQEMQTPPSLTAVAPEVPEPTPLNHHNFGTEDSNDKHGILDDADEVTLVRRKRRSIDYRPAIGYEPVSQRGVPPTLFALALVILLAAAAVALVYRFRGDPSTTPPTVQGNSSPNVSEISKTEDPHADVASVVPDLSGNWKVVNTVEKTSYQPYKNLEVGFELAINQTGNEFTGTGQKVSENGRSLAGISRTPIVVQGSIDGDKVEATFSETGTARKTNGRFVWRIDKASGGLKGRFASTAARASGRSAATKQL